MLRPAGNGAPPSPSPGRRAVAVGNTLSVRDVCERYGVGDHTVLQWIRSGELKAFLASRRRDSKRPRWRISAEALAAFELARTPTAPPPRARRRKRSADVIEFYK
jgi:excisionase family DNA binding protein